MIILVDSDYQIKWFWWYDAEFTFMNQQNYNDSVGWLN